MLEPAEREKLRTEFDRGVGARYDHILADSDAPRPDKVDQITEAFGARNAVILHAPSGQGKSTIAYRYMRQELPEAWRYLVRVTDRRDHAQLIANALEGYAEALGEQIVVFVDVRPQDTAWPELVERLAYHRRIRLVVAVREEDWRRARFVDTDVFRDVELAFDRYEAEQIYSSLVETRRQPSFLDFEDAWAKFGEKGPLLEFVYLVTQGGLLRERLGDQIAALKREANRGKRGAAELELLRLVAVASAYSGRLSIKALAAHLKMPALDEAINLLENEYLVRRTSDQTLVEGLHPVRSEILVELLTDRVITSWSTTAATVVQLLDERDMENFLLHAFSRRREDIDEMLSALAAFQPPGWIGIAGIIRALIWLGLREYADANEKLIKDARRDSGPGWSVVMDVDIARAMPREEGLPLDSLRNLASEERLAQMEALRKRQTPKETAFSRVASWLKTRTVPPYHPSSDEEWLAAATAAFWIGRLGASWPLLEWLPREMAAAAVDKTPLDAAADLVVGLADAYGDSYDDWMEGIRPALRERFQREMLSPVLEDDGSRIFAHFLIPPDEPEETNTAGGMVTLDLQNPLHNEALTRVDVLRRLFPDREFYGCQGYGHGANLLSLYTDDTHKNAIPRDRLSLRWQTTVNATFGGIVAYEARPPDWPAFAKEVLRLREEVVDCLSDLKKALPRYLRSDRPLALSIPSENWYTTWHLLRDPPQLPQCAVDEWGFSHEVLKEVKDDHADNKVQIRLEGISTVRKYRVMVEAMQAYAKALENFLLQAAGVISANLDVHKHDKREQTTTIASNTDSHWAEVNDRRISTIKLAQAWMALPVMQGEYHRLFENIVDSGSLDALDRQETGLFSEVWPLWYAFAIQPDRVLKKPILYARKAFDRTFQNLQNALQRELRGCAEDDISVSVSPGKTYWEAEPVLCLTVDGADGLAVYNAADNVLDAVCRAILSVADTELRRHVLDFHWEHIVVVPLIRGQSLDGMAWRVHSGVLISAGSVEELSWAQLVMRPIPQQALAQLGIQFWDDESLALGARLAEAANQLWPVIVYMAELSKLPEVEDVGEEIALRHIPEMMNRVSAAIQEVMDAISELTAAINDSLSESPEPTGEFTALAVDAVKELYKAVLPTEDFDGSATVEIRQFEEMAERLRVGLRYALIAQLAWASSVLETANQEP